MSKELLETDEAKVEPINAEEKVMSKPIEVEPDDDDDYDFEKETESIRYSRRLYALNSMAKGISQFFEALSSLSNPFDI